MHVLFRSFPLHKGRKKGTQINRFAPGGSHGGLGLKVRQHLLGKNGEALDMPEYLLHTEALISGQFAFQNTESHLCLGQRGIQLMRHIADELAAAL